MDMNKTKEEQAKEFIRDCIIKKVPLNVINKSLKKNFGMHLKSNPKSKYVRHMGAKEMEKALKTGKVIKQSGMTAECSVSYAPVEPENATLTKQDGI